MKMEIYYFTFGSSEQFPYQNTYVVVIATNYKDAITAFRKKYPDITENCLNCSDYYTEKQWKEIGKHYKEPADVIWTESSLGDKPEGYNDLFVFVQDTRQIIRISEGTGDNLLPEDVEAGYVDYIYYEQYELETDIQSVDGGMILLKELVRDKYGCLADCLKDVLEMAYGSCIYKCKILI